MQLFLWLASFDKVRKDELIGFLKLVTPKQADQLEEQLNALIQDGRIEVGNYQKLFLAKNEQFVLSTAVAQCATYNIPPHPLTAFLHNQGVQDTEAFMQEVRAEIQSGNMQANAAGMLMPIYGNYVQSQWYKDMYERMRRTGHNSGYVHS